jgi:AsmA protein
VRIANAIVVVDKIDALIPAVGELTGSGTVSSADERDFKLAAKIASAQGIGKAGAGLLTKLNSSGETSKTRLVCLSVSLGRPRIVISPPMSEASQIQ